MNSNYTIPKTPTFTVYDQQGIMLPHVLKAFLETRVINLDNPPATITSRKGVIYQAVYDNFVCPSNSKVAKVLISFQTHIEGHFAVIRLDYSTD